MSTFSNSGSPSTPPHRVHFPIPISPSESSLFTQIIPGTQVTDKILKACAELFSNNYGKWGADGFRPGERIKMSPMKLRTQCLSAPESTYLITCIKGVDELIAHAFVTLWEYTHEGKTGQVAWVTQLVVNSSMRRRYIATSLFQQLKTLQEFPTITAIGLVSSHAGAVQALVKCIPTASMSNLNMNFIKSHAPSIFSASPIEYLQPSKMQLRGSLFESAPAPGVISAVFTEFFVDHTEPLQALQNFSVKQGDRWCLGDLPEGHEFLVICPTSCI